VILPSFVDPFIGDPDLESNPELCNRRFHLNIDEDIVTVHFRKKIPTPDPDILGKHFVLKTAWLWEPIIFPQGSAEVTVINHSVISLRYFLLVLDNYTGKLFCVLPKAVITRN
jgi:hypothetical protein